LPEKELEIQKKVFSENLKVNLGKNEFVASNAIREKIYGSHPYGRSISLNDIESINIETLQKFFTERFKPFQIFIVGKASHDILESIRLNIDLTKTPPPYPNHSLGEPQQSSAIIQGPSNTQASIRFGVKTISRSHPDWAGLQITNHILGGYFGSRLMKNIREEKGLSYGIHSSIQSMLHSSWVNIAAEVNSEKVDLALGEIKNELARLNEVEIEELEMTKNHFIGSLQNDITTIFAASERIKNLILNDLPTGFYQNLIQTINTIDKDDLDQICTRYFASENFSSVVVK
jgi:predicted Zn-dependent peptidase